MGVVRVMKEMKLSCCKCLFEFFTTVANDEEGHPPVPFDILFHTHNDSQTSQTGRGSILHLHILFLYTSLPFFCTTTTRNFQKLLRYTFYGGNVVRVPVHFFSLPLIFTLHWWPLAFLILSPLQNFHVVLPTKKCLLRFFISRSKSLSPFFSLSFAGLPPTFSFSLSFSCSIFQICGYENIYLSLIL